MFSALIHELCSFTNYDVCFTEEKFLCIRKISNSSTESTFNLSRNLHKMSYFKCSRVLKKEDSVVNKIRKTVPHEYE